MPNDPESADPASADPASDPVAIEAVIRGIFENFAAHRSDGVEGALDADCTIWDLFVPDLIKGPAERERFHDADQAQMQARGKLTMTIETPLIDVWGDTALARYRLSFVYEPPNAISGIVRITDVLRRKSGRWVVVHHHEGIIPTGVPPIA
jgi:ketosteroid isomerase-like protein